MIERIINALVEPMKIIALACIVILLIVLLGYTAEVVMDKLGWTKVEMRVKQQPVEVSSKSALVPVSYTFIMNDGTTNYVDLTQVKEMNTNYDFVKVEERHDN